MRGSYGGPAVDARRHATGPGVWPYGGPPGFGVGQPGAGRAPEPGPPTRRRRRGMVLAVAAAGTVAALVVGAVAAWPSSGQGAPGGGASHRLPTGELPPDPQQYEATRAA